MTTISFVWVFWGKGFSVVLAWLGRYKTSNVLAYWGHNLDLFGSRDVIGHITI